jgi:hypothetical protein
MVGVAILVALAGTWSAGSSPKGHQGRVIVRSVTGGPGTARPASGPTQKVYIDPATGAIRDPTPEEEKALADAAAASQSAGIGVEAVPVALPSGGEALRVPDDLATSLVATRNPDGSITVGHAPANGLGTQPASGVTQKREHSNDR